jgi:23S rRNA pseudouridine1911/1915/1917 synthase
MDAAPKTSGQHRKFQATSDDVGRRLDQFLTAALENVSRVRVQELIEQEKVRVNGHPARASLKLRGDDVVEVTGEAERPPLKAFAEDIPLDIVYEDEWLAVVNKPAGMIVHSGAGNDERNRGTLVNALLFRFQKLSAMGGEARPGIVHRLDKDTSGLMVVAKTDEIHRKLAAQFASRQVKKRYIALVMGWPADKGTIEAEISRDRVRPTRMTTRRSGGRSAVSHYRVTQKLENAYGKFALLDVEIETGRTHQIRVHLGSLHHPVVGDTLYGAPGMLRIQQRPAAREGRKDSEPEQQLSLERNFLHAGTLEFVHPATHEGVRFDRPLPADLQNFLNRLNFGASAVPERELSKLGTGRARQ